MIVRSKQEVIQLADKFKIPIALSFFGTVLIIGGLVFPNSSNSSKNEYPKESLIESQKLISVDVSGAVNRPGVYKLSANSRVEDAIRSSGGFSSLVNKSYVSKYLNLAQKLTDGAKIYVPFEGESNAQVSQIQPVLGTSQSIVNINLASQSELEALPGIGPVTASRIISDRPYQNIDDLLAKKVVNKSTFEKIKTSIGVF